MKKYFNQFPRRPISVANDIQLDVSKSKVPNYTSMEIDIVYFANLFVNNQGLVLIQHQMHDLMKCGLLNLENTRLHMVISVPSTYNKEEFTSTLKNRFSPHHKINVELVYDNCVEYPGISKVHELSQTTKSRCHYLLYYHSKGMSRFDGKNRERTELELQKLVVNDWEWILFLFENISFVDKAGSSTSKKGWMWWNFWWARASYLSCVEKPIKTKRRHYYEDWLARRLRSNDVMGSTEEIEVSCQNTNIYNIQHNNSFCLSQNPPKFCNLGTPCGTADALSLLV